MKEGVAFQDSDSLRALGASLLSDDLVVFPVRHHSPACALHVRRLIQERRPSIVLIEGPRSFNQLIPLLTHESARMPLAIYTYSVERASEEGSAARHAAYYPFCDYSPELVALRGAAELGVSAKFIDLDYAEQCLIQATPSAEDAVSLLAEQNLERSAHLRLLARRLGCRDHEDLWEHLFECPGASLSLQEHVTNVAAYCALARDEAADEELTSDGTYSREAEMAWHIREALRERRPGSGPVLAVVGGFHAVVLPHLVSLPVERPDISRSSIAEEHATVIRYSFDRLDRLNGYSAGMTSPAWHQQLWERLVTAERSRDDHTRRVRESVALNALFDIAAVLREEHRVSVPMPTLAAAFRHALELARLRQRYAPARDDVVDAVTSCFIKGDIQAEGPVVFGAIHTVLTGNATGRVPAGAPKPPLLRDFEYRSRRQRLKVEDSEPRRVLLDIYRRPEHRVTSRLLHGLTFLGIPFAVRTAGPDFVRGTGLNRLQEHWEYCYSAATEASIIEAALHGATVPLAVADRFRLQLENDEKGAQARSARAAAALLVQGCTLGLHDHLPGVLRALRAAIAQDSDFQSVSLAAGSVGLLWESREPLEARDIAELPEVLRSAYERATYLGRGIGTGSDASTATGMMEALTRLRELLTSAAGAALDGELYWQMVAQLVERQDEPALRGTASGLLFTAGRLDATRLAALVAGEFIGAADSSRAVAFLRGLLHSAREAAWQQPALLQALDGMLATWSEATFIALLPEMRLAFAHLTPRETDRVGEAVAALLGGESLGGLVNYDVGEVQLAANLDLSRALLAVLDADGLQAWVRQ